MDKINLTRMQAKLGKALLVKTGVTAGKPGDVVVKYGIFLPPGNGGGKGPKP